ncbi:GNAT family N-acetyltransferase [Rhizobium deserti]|uniref:GNAT family N-acetyltransferase n=1 Tax=Rhizobium deserti TaxID=2547961 RepID=A0A4R5UMU7_9HYPH|nr:GNAT family N-acetyltransferase [Rhizobium deserti]TDK39213.1 GNAT family N-acetyltransferase [Rhizobium deserti]
MDLFALDNPIWYSLSTAHRNLAITKGLALRYPIDVAPFAGLADYSPAGMGDLRKLAVDADVALFTGVPLEPPADLEVLKSLTIEQMYCNRVAQYNLEGIERLRSGDVEDMLRLVSATRPGPFSGNTIVLGEYYGVRSEDGRLVAMAGQRLMPEGFVEISAVCTDPEFQGLGLARNLVGFLVSKALSQGVVPFLHVKTENGARQLYRKIGFQTRRLMQLTVLRPA